MAFRPLPLLGNPHVQTVLGTLLPGGADRMRARTHTISLADGDQVLLHETPAQAADAPIAILVHGLGGCAASGYMLRMTQRLTVLGWRAFRMDLRGAGAGVHLARRLYTAACSEDVRAVLTHLAAAYPGAPIAVAGFSLGGNIVLKMAGEIGDAAGPLVAVAAIAPPIDLVACSEMIARLPIYDSWYVRNLIKQVRQHQRHFPEQARAAFPRGTTLRVFDDVYTAPRWGYAGWLDYYQQASAFTRIAAIRVPTFILTARDDPFVAVAPFEALGAPANVELHISERGGHLGFLGRDDAGGIRWSETQVANWLNTVAARSSR